MKTGFAIKGVIGGCAALMLMSSAAIAQIQATIAVAEPQTIRLAAAAFKNYVEGATDGAIQVRVVIHDAIGGARAATDQMRVGELQFNFVDAGGTAGIVPDLQIFSWPFLFPNRSVFYELMMDPEYVNQVQDVVTRRSNGTLVFFGGGENSIRHIYTTRGPIRVPQDLTAHSIKMRTRELLLDQKLFAALGSPQIVALPAPERYTALQTGLIDGTEGGLESAWTAGLLEVSKWTTLTGHAYDYFLLLGNSEFYNKLTNDQKAAINEGARLMMWVNHGHKITAEAKVLEDMRKAGINVYIPTESEQAQWQQLARPVGEEVIAQTIDKNFIDATLTAIERVQEKLSKRAPK